LFGYFVLSSLFQIAGCAGYQVSLLPHSRLGDALLELFREGSFQFIDVVSQSNIPILLELELLDHGLHHFILRRFMLEDSIEDVHFCFFLYYDEII
jgi:hypothetical protein